MACACVRGDMETLLELTEEELAKLGLNKLGKRKKLFSHIQHLKLSAPRKRTRVLHAMSEGR